jgi:hypothetical protein
VLVTDRVVDLTSGSNLSFSPHATVELKGAAGRWQLHLASEHAVKR